MTSATVLSTVCVALAVFILGILAGYAWRRRLGNDRAGELKRRMNIALSAFFTLIALMVAIDVIALTIKFNRYVSDTLVRDQAQENCNTATLEVLTHWVDARAHRDRAMDARDEATIAVLNRIIAEEQADPREVKAWRDAVAVDRLVRAEASADRFPLPTCSRETR